MGDASNANDGKGDDSFAGWWLGGFGCAGAIVAGVLAAVFTSLGFVESAGIAALGAIVGVVIAIRLAVAFVLLAGMSGSPVVAIITSIPHVLSPGDLVVMAP